MYPWTVTVHRYPVNRTVYTGIPEIRRDYGRLAASEGISAKYAVASDGLRRPVECRATTHNTTASESHRTNFKTCFEIVAWSVRIDPINRLALVAAGRDMIHVVGVTTAIGRVITLVTTNAGGADCHVSRVDPNRVFTCLT